MDAALLAGIIGAIATVLGTIVGAIITDRLTQRQEQKKEVRHTLKKLLKIEADLRVNRTFFDDLAKNQDDSLDVIDNKGFLTFYRQLPPGHRKRFWERTVKEMLLTNKAILVRLEELTGNQDLSSAFFDDCEDLTKHAKEWERMWTLAMEFEPHQEPDTFIQDQQKNRRRFPSRFEASLKNEIASLKNRLRT